MLRCNTFREYLMFLMFHQTSLSLIELSFGLKRCFVFHRLILCCHHLKFQSLPWLQNSPIRIFPNVPSTRLTTSPLKRSLTILWYCRILCHESIDLIKCLNYWFWKCHFNWWYCLRYRFFRYYDGCDVCATKIFWITISVSFFSWPRHQMA